jgi:hypothetical protein
MPEPKLVVLLHLPVQSGSDRILALMKRGHTALEYKAKIRRVRAARPDISMSSDFIVGFPGETERRFRGHPAADRGRRLRHSPSASSTAPARARRPPRCRTSSRPPRSSAGSRCCSSASTSMPP